ncbi:hypothetical protein GCK72_022457 [Caenorhabditis remanei]|uniref:Uncharacterized protein n=1 Tax=Caenorhabditis remanei TaxID=31234 RepID=A0A6A5FU22_CAERE|nr:hypothetical protein GCK72_022457 [Caenorhabditis remanei]KAF1746006.1 hypothetical protein GCK72_022457 [Caenorhabditis remanei]
MADTEEKSALYTALNVKGFLNAKNPSTKDQLRIEKKFWPSANSRRQDSSMRRRQEGHRNQRMDSGDDGKQLYLESEVKDRSEMESET